MAKNDLPVLMNHIKIKTMKNYIYIILLTLFVHIHINAQVISPDLLPVCSDSCSCYYTDTIPVLVKLLPVSQPASPVSKPLKDTTATALKTTSTSKLYPHIPNRFTPDRSKIVGEIPITGNITPTGAQSYTIPINTEPGANGVQANVSIIYNSQGGNGVLGRGWSIGGLPAIVRANRGIYYDGTTQGVTNTTSDAFYLDGTRLVRLSSNSSSITYESEQGNVKVVAYTSGSTVKYFKVHYPNGSTAIMGYTTNTTNKFSYPVTHITDKHNNVINYSYSYIDNNYRINNIQYGQNGNSAHFAGVYFSYTTRNDIRFAWQNGLKVQNRYLLSSISCKNGSTTVSTYRFNYNGDKLLQQVNCSVGESSLNPLKFYYGEGSKTARLEKSGEVMIGHFTGNQVLRKGKFDGWSDNDGLIVYPNKNPSAYSNGQFYNQYHNDQSLLVQLGLASTVALPITLKAEREFRTLFAANIDGKPGDEVIKINHNNIGNSYMSTQFKVYGKSGTTGLVLRKTIKLNGQSIATLRHPHLYYAGDFNGNGKMEIFSIKANVQGHGSKCVVYDLNSEKVVLNRYVFNYAVDLNNHQNDDIVIPFDYNGDGKTDIIHINSSGTHVYTFNTNNEVITGMQKVASYPGLKKTTIKDRHFQAGEFNGDGKPDLLVSPLNSYKTYTQKAIPVSTPHTCFDCGLNDPIDHSPEAPNFLCKRCRTYLSSSSECYSCKRRLSYSSWQGGLVCSYHGKEVSVEVENYVDRGKNWTIYYSKGDGQFDRQNVTIRNTEGNDVYELLDINGDGTSDLVCCDNRGYTYAYLCKNGKISSTRSGYTYVGKGTKLVSTEIASGNYYSTLITIKDGKAQRINYSTDETVQSRLTAVVNSYGTVNKTRYAKMNSGEYSLYTEGYGAVLPYQNFNGPILLAAETQTWNNNTKTTHLAYSYIDAILHCQGLGFRGFKRINTTNRVSGAYTYSFYDPLRYGVLTRQDTREASVVNSYSVSVGTNKIAKVRLTGSTVTDKLKNNTINKSYEYDTYGNPTREHIDYGSGITTTTTIIYNNYTGLNTSGIYILGIPTSKQVVKQANNNTFTGKTEWTYNNSKGIPMHITSYHNNLQVSRVSYTYDSFGNITGETTKAYSSPNSLTTSYKYSTNGRFITETTNPMGQKTRHNRNPRGFVSSKTDFKGNTTSYQYDALGRVNKVEYPTGEELSTSYNWDTSGGNYMYSVSNTSNISPAEKIHYDAFGRELKSGTIGFTGWIYTYKEYDTRGRLYRSSLPTYSSSKKWNTTSFDTYNRPSRITEASGAVTMYSYSGNSVTVTKEGRSSTKTTNARGDLVKASDPGGTINYQVRADGQPSAIIAPGGVTTRFTYDNYGRKTSMTDPSAGTITYQYDAAGNLYKQTNGNGKVSTRTYDRYNRLVSETTPEISTAYTYNEDGLATGSTSNNGTSTAYTYNSLLQLTGFSETVDGHTYSETYGYSKGRVDNVTYMPLNYKVTNEYNSNNYLIRKKNGSTTLWTLNMFDAFGNILGQSYGNGISVTQSFDAYGFPTAIRASKNNASLQHFGYSFNRSTGNLNSRSDQLRNLAESFEYDNLDRLTHCTAMGNTVETQYYANGNIKTHPGIGTYQYLNNKPYAVKGVENTGNAIPIHTQNISYTSFERPKQLSENGNTLNYTYNANYNRAKTVSNSNSGTSTSLSYANGKYQRIQNGSEITERLYLGGDPYSAFAVLERKNSSNSLYYLHRDYLGSITMVTDANGNKEAEYSYTAWGQLRNPTSWQTYNAGSEPSLLFGRGYTGHEHLHAFGLINMNARLYDASIGRFLSPDPYVQAPDFTQNFNRYSYCLNNPLKFNDPNGEFWHIVIGAAIGGIINLAANWNNIDNFWEGVAAFGIGAGAGALTAATGGAAAGTFMASTGASLGAAAIGGATIGATNNIISQTGNGVGIGDVNWGQVGLSAAVGGVAGIAGAGAGKFATNKLGNAIVNGMQIKSPMLSQGINGMIGGAVGGYAGGFTSGFLFSGGDLNAGFQGGWSGLKSGAIIGGGIGLGSGYAYAKQNNLNIWNGKSLIPKYDFTPDAYGDNVTMYRGTTGSEGKGGPLFMTDNPEYAATYVKNGGQVIQVTIPRSTYMQMQYNGHIQTYQGVHGGSYGYEYQIHPSIVPNFLQLFK